jgi:hypothetical protein
LILQLRAATYLFCFGRWIGAVAVLRGVCGIGFMRRVAKWH